MPKVVTDRQKRFLLRKGTTLTPKQRNKFLRELMAGEVTVTKDKKKKGGSVHQSGHKNHRKKKK